jgi:predicted nucleotidyltransferase
MSAAHEPAGPFGAYPDTLPKNLPIKLPAAKDLADFCRKSRIHELGIFGRVFDPDFPAAAAVEVIVRFRQGRGMIPDQAKLESWLSDEFGRPVKLIEHAQVQANFNPILNQRLLKTKRRLYFEF